MTSYAFALTEDADDAHVARLLDDMETRFPDHDFQCVRDPSPMIVESINPVGQPDAREVAAVRAAFRIVLDGMRGWKPS